MSTPRTKPLGHRRFHAPRSSIPAGDLVLAMSPPYLATPWMGAGIPLIMAVLEQHGLRSRVVRFLDDPRATPAPILEHCEATLWTDPPLQTRLEGMQVLADAHPDYFEQMLATLLEGPEKIFGFSVWRHNADVTLELTRRLKEARPDALVILGGPEAVESLQDLGRPWIDVVVTGASEGVIAPVVQACRAGEPAQAAVWEHVWVNPKHRPRVHLSKRKAELPPIPKIDYCPLIPLFLDDPDPSIPVLLNVGCPFRCGFCTNTSIYPEMEWGSPRRLFEEMRDITDTWATCFEGPPAALFIEMCDATVNARPPQFDELCRMMAAHTFPTPLSVHGSFVIDHRITPERVQLYIDAGFISLFFGLESASPRVRRAMKKPGSIASVARALRTIRDVGQGRMTVNFNVIVGWPDETEEEFHQTVAFIEWAATLGVISDAGVMPLSATPYVMDKGLFAQARGDTKGFCWKTDGPAGTPSVRCRRYLSIFERFHGLLPITSALPRRKVMRWMMPELPEAFIDAWCRTHGDDHERGGQPFSMLLGARKASGRQGPGGSPEASATELADTVPVDLSTTAYVVELEAWLEPDVLVGTEVHAGWLVHALAPWGEHERAAVVQLVCAADGRMMVVVLEPKDEARRAFARTARFNVSYLNEYRDVPCAVDLGVLRALLALVARREREETTTASLSHTPAAS